MPNYQEMVRDYRKFFFSIPKDISDMNHSELVQELERAIEHQEDCRKYEQGIGSKETVRGRATSEQLRINMNFLLATDPCNPLFSQIMRLISQYENF